jgi:hypothetical protein
VDGGYCINFAARRRKNVADPTEADVRRVNISDVVRVTTKPPHARHRQRGLRLQRAWFPGADLTHQGKGDFTLEEVKKHRKE